MQRRLNLTTTSKHRHICVANICAPHPPRDGIAFLSLTLGLSKEINNLRALAPEESIVYPCRINYMPRKVRRAHGWHHNGSEDRVESLAMQYHDHGLTAWIFSFK